MTNGILLFLWAISAFDAQPPPVQILYPHADGAILALPHVSVIFKTHAPRAGQLIRSVEIEVDGRKVPEDAVAHCAICAGPNPAVLVAKAPWTIYDGEHHVVIVVKDSKGNEYRSELRYVMDSSVPSLSGLTGGITFPNADVASARSLRLGAFHQGRSDDFGAWLGVTSSRRVGTLEVVGNALFPRGERRDLDASWKLNLTARSRSRFGFSVGQREGDAFAVLSYRTQPNYFNVSLGVGASDLPSAWLGVSYGLGDFTPRLKHSKRLDNFIALVDLVRLHGEVDNKGKVNLGATFSHPYGIRGGLYRVRSGLPDASWQLQVSYSIPIH